MRRFFIQPDTVINEEVQLSHRETHHIKKVLRLSPGTHLQLLDGLGNVHDAEILSLADKAQLKILSSIHIQGDKTPLRVCQSILKGQKMELLIQKCTELGVALFTPYYSERSQLKKTELAKIEKKQLRWQRIIEEACKQCNNPIMMRLSPLRSFEEMLRMEEAGLQKLLFWEEEPQQTSLHSCPPQPDNRGLQIVFGPEGGFPETEVMRARNNGFQILNLGPRILKAETANIAAVSIIQHLLGNM